MESRTSATLLARLRQVPPDQAAWVQFTERYGRKIYAWCRRWNLQGADAEDLTQDVLLKLAEKMQTFVYDPAKSFRGWLKTVARHAWSDSWSGRKAAPDARPFVPAWLTCESAEEGFAACSSTIALAFASLILLSVGSASS